MILPNKVIPYKDSIFPRLVSVLEILVKGDKNIELLYKELQDDFEDINQFIVTLDVLFVLEKIDFDEKSKAVKYVKANNL